MCVSFVTAGSSASARAWGSHELAGSCLQRGARRGFARRVLALGELDAQAEAAIEPHLLGCGHCSAALQCLVDLGAGIAALVRQGLVRSVLTPATLKRLSDRGLRVREYRIPANGSVYCTVTREDDLLAARLEAPLGGVRRLDLIADNLEGPAVERMADVPFDAQTGEVVLAARIDKVRGLPACTSVVRLVAVGEKSEQLLGTYTFHHSPPDAS